MTEAGNIVRAKYETTYKYSDTLGDVWLKDESTTKVCYIILAEQKRTVTHLRNFTGHERKHINPHLYRMALDYLSIPGMFFL